MEITFGRLGESALTVRTDHAAALHADLASRPPRGVAESVPAHGLLTVLFDPLATDADLLTAELRARLGDLALRPAAPGRLVEIPVTYDGPDLAGVAAALHLSEREVTALHAGVTYDVTFLGFLPGFAYLGGLPGALRLPRRAAPRPRVEAGSVAIGGPWTGVYPLASPGGWHLLGRTDAALFDPHAPEPTLLRAGDRVRFVPVGGGGA